MTTPATLPAPLPAALPANMPAAVQPLDNAMRVPLALLAPSPLNPRKHRTPEHVQRIADSLKARGQLQPIRVRANPQFTATNGRPPFEIVAGETRWHAARLADLPTLDAVLGVYTDQEVIEIGLSENADRDPLTPLEEAQAFEALMRKPNGLQGYATVPELAARFGRSTGYVYQRLKLLALCPAGRAALQAGTIDASVAVLAARMPDQAEQARFINRVVSGFGGEPFSYRQAAQLAQADFMLKLAHARFDIAHTYAVAGPCTACTKRSGAAPDLFNDLPSSTGDMCQDAACYKAKAEEEQQRLIRMARDAGHTVLQGAAARRALPNPQGAPVGYRRTAEACPELTDSRKPLGDLLHKDTPRVVVDHPDAPGTLVELVAEADAIAALRKRNQLRQTAMPSPPAKPAAPGATSTTTAGTAPTGQHPSPRPATPGADVTPSPRQAQPAADRSPHQQGEGKGTQRDAHPAASGQGAGAAQPVEHVGSHHTAAGRRGISPAEAAAQMLRPERFGQLLGIQLARVLQGAGPDSDVWQRTSLLALRMVVDERLQDLSIGATQLVYDAMTWRWPEVHELLDDIQRRVATASGRTLAELLVLVQVAEPLTDTPHPDALYRSTAQLLQAAGVSVGAAWSQAATEDAYTAAIANATAQPEPEPDATDVFLAQHDAPSTRPETVVDPDWKFPSNHI